LRRTDTSEEAQRWALSFSRREKAKKKVTTGTVFSERQMPKAESAPGGNGGWRTGSHDEKRYRCELCFPGLFSTGERNRKAQQHSKLLPSYYAPSHTVLLDFTGYIMQIFISLSNVSPVADENGEELNVWAGRRTGC